LSELLQLLNKLESEGWCLTAFDFEKGLRIVVQKGDEAFSISGLNLPSDVREWSKTHGKFDAKALGALFG